MIIHNFGLFWERASVEWGSGPRGQLRGFVGQRDEPIDFAHQAGIYLLYEGFDTATHRVVYVGQAGLGRNARGLYRRLEDHTTDTFLWNRWTRFSWFGIYNVGKKGELVHRHSDKGVHTHVREVLDQLEGCMMSVLEPVLNKQGPHWRGAVEYTQYKGEDYDPGDPFHRYTPPPRT